MESVMNAFPIGSREYKELEVKFGKLCHKAAWIFLQKNYNNNHTEDQSDIVQRLRIDMIRAGSYYKRQNYIEDSLSVIQKHITDRFMKRVVKQLCHLWENRRSHGANRQKFGPFQEEILDRLLQKHVPVAERPDKNKLLDIDSKFAAYCKRIIWNSVKSLGKRITREKSYRTGMVSLSEYDYLGSSSLAL